MMLSRSNCSSRPHNTMPAMVLACTRPLLKFASEGWPAMQRLQDDPLQRTIETVMPLDQLNEDDKVLHVPSFVPATVDKVCGIIFPPARH